MLKLWQEHASFVKVVLEGKTLQTKNATDLQSHRKPPKWIGTMSSKERGITNQELTPLQNWMLNGVKDMENLQG